jgi:hypothetical protein
MISDADIRNYVMRLMAIDFVPSIENVAAMIGHLDATDYRMVDEAAMTSAIRSYHTTLRCAELLRERSWTMMTKCRSPAGSV